MLPGERIELSTPGGGGYGNPQERDRASVARDVEYGRVSRELAEELYGWREA
jgi:N-methylhydantoinase B/oxoprolinase/acetone carboxylase alpha subunit